MLQEMNDRYTSTLAMIGLVKTLLANNAQTVSKTLSLIQSILSMLLSDMLLRRSAPYLRENLMMISHRSHSRSN